MGCLQDLDTVHTSREFFDSKRWSGSSIFRRHASCWCSDSCMNGSCTRLSPGVLCRGRWRVCVLVPGWSNAAGVLDTPVGLSSPYPGAINMDMMQLDRFGCVPGGFIDFGNAEDHVGSKPLRCQCHKAPPNECDY